MSRKPSRQRRGRTRPRWRWWAWVFVAAALVFAVLVGILDYAPRLFRVTPIAPGERAPAFILESAGGERVDVAKYLGREALLVIFFPGYQ